jgi:Nucleoside permease
MELANNIGRGLLGMLALLAIAYLLSRNRRAIDWRLVAAGIGLQVVFAVLILKVPGVSTAFDALPDCLLTLSNGRRKEPSFCSAIWLPAKTVLVIFSLFASCPR